MASWTVTIEATNLAQKRVRVTGVRTDGLDVRTYTVEGQVDIADLPTSRQKIVDRLYGAYQEDAARDSQIATLLTGWEAALESDLNALES